MAKNKTAYTQLIRLFTTGFVDFGRRYGLDGGNNVRFIQELLGHNDIRTTLRYSIAKMYGSEW